MALNNPAPLSCQNIVSFDANKTPNITAISGCNIGCIFCKYLIIQLISGKTGSLCFAERCAITNPSRVLIPSFQMQKKGQAEISVHEISISP